MRRETVRGAATVSERLRARRGNRSAPPNFGVWVWCHAATSTGGGLRRQLQSVGEGRALSPALLGALELLEEGCLRLRP